MPNKYVIKRMGVMDLRYMEVRFFYFDDEINKIFFSFFSKIEQIYYCQESALARLKKFGTLA